MKHLLFLLCVSLFFSCRKDNPKSCPNLQVDVANNHDGTYTYTWTGTGLVSAGVDIPSRPELRNCTVWTIQGSMTYTTNPPYEFHWACGDGGCDKFLKEGHF